LPLSQDDEQIVPVPEVAVDRPRRHAGALGDVLQRRPLEALFPGQLQRRVKKPGAGPLALVPLRPSARGNGIAVDAHAAHRNGLRAAGKSIL